MPNVYDKIPDLGGDGQRLRAGLKNVIEDLALMARGILNPKSFASGYMPVKNPVELRVFDGHKLAKLGGKLISNGFDATGERAHWEYRHAPLNFDEQRWKCALKAVRRSHNLRVTMGRDQLQRLQQWGNISANAFTYTGQSSAATATSATSLTNSGAAFPTSGGPNAGLQGQIVVCPVAAVYGVITANTATALTVSQWTSFTSATGAAGSTPASTAAYSILPWAGPSNWVGISTNASAAAAADVLRSADGLFGDGTTSGAATEQNANGLVRTFVPPTFVGAGNITLGVTFTYTGSSLVTINKAILCNSNPAVGSLMYLETLINAPAPLNTVGDAVVLSWAISL
jgi:hypothetical protein